MIHYAQWTIISDDPQSHVHREMPHTRRSSKVPSLNKEADVSTASIPKKDLPKGKLLDKIQSNTKLRRIDHIKISDMNELMIKFEIGSEIGKGAFGVVVQITDKFTEKPWAMKIIEKNKKKPREIKALEREIQILKLVSHPHIIYLHRVYECNTKIFLILELCNGDLHKEIKQRKMFIESEGRRLAGDLLSAVAYLHKNGRYSS